MMSSCLVAYLQRTLELIRYSLIDLIYPPASEASREVANFTERKNLHTPVCGVKDFVCLPVSQNFDPNYLGTGKTEWAEIVSNPTWGCYFLRIRKNSFFGSWMAN